jgi:hypothetical protein
MIAQRKLKDNSFLLHIHTHFYLSKHTGGNNNGVRALSI